MMIRPFTLFCALFAGVSGMVLYAQKHKTTLLDKEITKIVYDTNKIKSQTAMLRTEWTLLNQPDRLKDLSAKFIPGLRALNPTQFVQMASATSALPPVQQDQAKDKTREQLVQNVAQSHGQSPSIIAEATGANNEPPIIVSQNAAAAIRPQQPTASTDNTVTNPAVPPRPANYKKVKTTEIASAAETVETTDVTPQPTKKAPVTITQNNNSNTIKPIRRKKVKTTEIADAAEVVETADMKPQLAKKAPVATTQNNNSDAVQPTRHKKVQTTEVADSTETANVTPQPIKRNHIENVSYNIQSGNPFSHNKTASTSLGNTATEKKAVKPTQQVATTVPKKRPAAVKVARNDIKRNNTSESALGGGADDALPAPVPFGH